MAILVIGGNGFIGRKLIRSLLADGGMPDVISMDVVPPKEKFTKSIEAYGNKFRFVRGDVSQLEDILSAIKAFSVEKVINLAYIMVHESDIMPRPVAKVNVLGMSNVFEAARLLGVTRVLYPSSHAIYGPQGDREVMEDDALLAPKLVYGLTKILNERMAAVYSEQYGTSIVGFRPCHVFGPGREALKAARLFTDLISLPAVGKPFSIGLEPWTYVWTYENDVVRFIRLLLDAPTTKYKIYNIGGWTATSAEVADIVRQYIPDAKIEFGDQSADLGSPRKVSNARAREEFGFSLTPLKDAVLGHINDARQEAGMPPIKVKA